MPGWLPVPHDPPATPNPTGACCYSFGTCVVKDRESCLDEGAIFVGGGQCDPNPCFADLGDHSGGVLVLHHTPGLTYTSDEEPSEGSSGLPVCASVNDSVAVPGMMLVHLLALFDPSAHPRMKGVTFGLDYDQLGLIDDFGVMGDFEIPTGDWPSSGTGNAVTWAEAQTVPTTEVYWFSVYSYATYYGPQTLSIVPHPVHGMNFANDRVPADVDPVFGAGVFGIGVDGMTPCPTSSPTLSGVVYADADSNCVQDPLELGVGGRFVRIDPPGWLATTASDGSFSLAVPSGTYTTTLLPKLYWPDTCIPSPIVTVPTGGTTTVNLGTVSTPANDLRVDLTSGPPPRPGGLVSYHVTSRNVGTLPLMEQSSLELPSEVAYLGSSPPGSYDPVVHAVTWSPSLVLPDVQQIRSVDVEVDVGVPMTALSATARVGPVAGDSTPSDNTDVRLDAVVGSYDPNDKVVSPNGQIPPDQNLVYQINFQNVGTAPAIDVVVRDTLETDLDISSFELGGASHEYTSFEISERELVWTFEGINLPDSTANEPESHGHVEFRLNPVSGLPPGTSIDNRAGIYFDFNPPVITNYASVSIEGPCACDSSWVQQNTPGPLAQRGVAVAYDSDRGVAVLFGGRDSTGTRFDETWEWDGYSWTEVATASQPSERAFSGMAYDSARQVMVLFGGVAASGRVGDTWEYDGMDWTYIETADSHPRSQMGMTYDADRGVVVRYGGEAGGGKGRSTWEYDGVSWAQVVVSSPPDYRSNHAMVFDADLGVTVVNGGVGAGNVASLRHLDVERVQLVSGRRCAGGSPGTSDGL